jgi:hypothetical protein
VFGFAGYWVIELFSDNAFDRSLEASMTAMFVFGPARAIIWISSGIGSGRYEAGDMTIDRLPSTESAKVREGQRLRDPPNFATVAEQNARQAGRRTCPTTVSNVVF